MPDILANAVSPSQRLSAAVCQGKQALVAADRPRVTNGTAQVTDSLALDAEYAADQPNASRWDYLAGVERTTAPATACVIAIEVHPATPGEVKRVVAKKAWALQILNMELGTQPVALWYWIASGRDGVSRASSEFRLLQKNRIMLVRHLRVDSC